MILQTKIFNHNYYPLIITSCNQDVASTGGTHDATSDSDLPDEFSRDIFRINFTSFNNMLGAIVKPFQVYSFTTSIMRNALQEDYDGIVKYILKINSTSEDYGNILSVATFNESVAHTMREVRVITNLKNYSNHVRDIFNYANDIDYEISFKLSEQENLKEIFEYINSIGFNNYKLNNYKLYGDGVYSIKEVPSKIKCPHAHLKLDTSPISKTLTRTEMLKVYEDAGKLKLNITKLKNDILFTFKINISVLKEMCALINSDNSIGVSLPFGIDAELLLKDVSGNVSPFKMYYRIIGGIIIFTDVDTESSLDIPTTLLYKIPFYNAPEVFNNNELVPTPSHLIINNNKHDLYSGKININAKSYTSILDQTTTNKNSFFTIKKISLDNTSDQELQNIRILNSPLPVKRLIVTNELIYNKNNFEIFVDVTNIDHDYENFLNIEFEYDTTSGIMQIPVTINNTITTTPNLEIDTIENLTGKHVPDFELLENKNTYTLSRKMYKYDKNRTVLTLRNLSNLDCTITDVKIESPTIHLQNLKTKYNISTIEEANNISPTVGSQYSKLQSIINLYEKLTRLTIYKYYENETDEFKNSLIKKLINENNSSIYNSFNFNLIDKFNDVNNAANIAGIIFEYEINCISLPYNILTGRQLLPKITYTFNGVEYVLYSDIYDNVLIGSADLLTKNNTTETKYLTPNTYNTIYIDINRKSYIKNIDTKISSDNNINIPDAISNNISIIDFKIINYDENSSYSIADEEFFINKNQFPLKIESGSTAFTGISYDLNLKQERYYKFKAIIYTNDKLVPVLQIPINILSSRVDIEEIVQFDKNDFFVRDNKYFVSLKYGVHKEKNIKIINKSETEIINIKKIEILGMSSSSFTVQAKINLDNIQFPLLLTPKSSINVKIDFLGSDPGHYDIFLVLHADNGEIYLNIPVFVNTKLKDVLVLMENKKGTNFTSALHGVDIDFIRLLNFGTDICSTQITKLGSDKKQFFVKDNIDLYPETITYLENIFAPIATGQKLGLLDIKLRDMIETFNLRGQGLEEGGEILDTKIQNAHILVEMLGECFVDHALPYFTKDIVDFGFVKTEQRNIVKRVDTFTIKNLGLSPFVITKITKTNKNSPFSIPLIGTTLPLKVDNEITLPINIINSKINDISDVYMDVFTFEIQDMKTKHIFTHDIIVKIELTENDREYFSFNSEFIKFGYCEINHFKTDDLFIKNFSTDIVNVEVTYSGDVEFQLPTNFNIKLLQNQTFRLPIYFYPHGISNFNGTILLNFNDGNYEKTINVYGMGVDFNSPLVYVENKAAIYYKQLKDELNRNVYI